MSQLDNILDDNATKAVPGEQTISGARIALIIIGVAITVPAFMIGTELAGALGLSNALGAFAVGAVIVAVVGALNGAVAAKSRLSTAMILQFSFGRVGSKAVNALFALALFGWFGVTTALFGRTVEAAALSANLGAIPAVWAAIAGGVVMTATTIFGFKALDRLSLLAVPLLVVFLFYAGWIAWTRQPWPGLETASDLTFGLAVSAIAGGYMVGVTLMPDLCRYAANAREAGIAAGLGLLIGYSAVLALAALAVGNADFLTNMVSLGLGAAALWVIVFATWTTNASNLYSNGLMLAAMTPASWPKWTLTAGAGLIGTLVALSPTIDRFAPFLITLGVALPPVSGIYIADFFFVRALKYETADIERLPAVNWRAFAAWAGGAGVAVLTAANKLTLTTIPALDSIIVAFGLYALLYSVNRPAISDGKH